MNIVRTILHNVGECISDYSMIKDGDRILVCFSGGKDSFVLLDTLEKLRKKAPIKFEIFVLCVNPNFKEQDYSIMRKFFEKEKYDYEILESNISKVIKEKNPKNPCSLCSRLRRGIVYKYAVKNKFNKIALGHNLDDAIETFLMNLFYSNKLHFMRAMYESEYENYIIRPLIYCNEDLIQMYCDKLNYVTFKQYCPLKEEDSTRYFVKEIIRKNKEKNPKIYSSFLSAMKSNYL
jgi:tRNA 2-thiocytidine biosynthesis protein TtcA